MTSTSCDSVGSAGVNDAHQLFDYKPYPEMLTDFLRTFALLKSLPCDIFLASHGKFYGLDAKYAKLNKGGPNPFIDPQGYKTELDIQETAFNAVLEEQKKAANERK